MLQMCGFTEEGEFLVLARDAVDMNLLNNVGGEITSAINNPFFGKL